MMKNNRPDGDPQGCGFCGSPEDPGNSRLSPALDVSQRTQFRPGGEVAADHSFGPCFPVGNKTEVKRDDKRRIQ